MSQAVQAGNKTAEDGEADAQAAEYAALEAEYKPVDWDNWPEEMKKPWQVIGVLGSGGYAKVYRVRHRASGEKYALKVVYKDGVRDMSRMEREVSALKRAQTSSIVRLYESLMTPKYIFLRMELLDGGCLFDRLIEYDDRGGFTEWEVAAIMKKVFEAVAFLHGVGIVHRDIKLENLLLVSANDNTNVKLTDFGIVSMLTHSPVRGGRHASRLMMQSYVGTVTYMAPEMFTGKPYDASVDMWACGVMLYMLLSLASPFGNDGAETEAEPEQIRRIMSADFNFDRPKIWQKRSASCKNLISRLLRKEPYTRPSAREALQHAWIKQLETGIKPL